ncbi:hypothetical protein HDV00_004118 [Rhizophlyctis rosea]|nr:hypothetical protein HDV00_004118 [Rhizophlyctis rosea]
MSVDLEDYTHIVGKRFVPGTEDVDNVISSGVPKERVIREQDLPLNYRVLDTKAFTTLEFIPDRLNLRIDENKIVKSVNLG